MLGRASVRQLHRLLLSIIIIVSEPLLLGQLFAIVVVAVVAMLLPVLEVVELMVLSEDRRRHPHTLPQIPLLPPHRSSLRFHIH